MSIPLHDFADSAAAGNAVEIPPAAVLQTLRCGIRLKAASGLVPVLLPVGRPAELRRDMTICAVPNVASWFVGMANLRGELVPVFDLLDYFGLAAPAPRRARELLLIGNAANAFALPVAGEPEVLRLSEDSAGAAPPPPALKEFVYNALKSADTHWYDFDFDRWLQRLAGGENASVQNPSIP